MNDDHRFPWEGNISWEKTISDFRKSAPAVPLLLEARRNGQEIAPSLEKANRVFEKFERIIEEVD